MADIIKIARDKVIEESRMAAILFLNYQTHLEGREWQVRYYRDETQTTIDTLVAIGIRNGTGSECYRVISYGTATPVIISETLPDVSDLAHGEIYITKVEGVWNYVILVDDVRRFDPISGGPYSFFNLADGHVWYYNEHNISDEVIPEFWLRRDDDFYTRKELDEYGGGGSAEHEREQDEQLAYDKVWLTDLDNVVFPINITVTSTLSSENVYFSGTSKTSTFTFKAEKILRYGLMPDPKPETEEITDVTSECEFYYKKSTESTYHKVTGSSVTVNGISGSNSIVTFNFKGGNIEKYGRMSHPGDISYKFGYSFLYGVTSGEFTSSSINSLLVSNLTMKSPYYSVIYTTTLDNLATFAIPFDWGNITKITDDGGVMNYTSSFEKLGTFNRTIEGTTIRYNVWRWSSLPTISTGFTYRFYN